MNLTDEACTELAEMFIEFGCQLPDFLVPRLQKIKIRASHSLINAGIRSSRQEVETFLKRFHYWLEKNNIEVENPDIEIENDNDIH